MPVLVNELKQPPPAPEPNLKFTQLKHHPILKVEYLNDLSSEERFASAFKDELRELLDLYERCTAIPTVTEKDTKFVSKELTNLPLDWNEISPTRIPELESRIDYVVDLRDGLKKAVERRVGKEREIIAILQKDRQQCMDQISMQKVDESTVTHLQRKITEIDGALAADSKK